MTDLFIIDRKQAFPEKYYIDLAENKLKFS
jgi:hypothetical protein